jgi:NAD(P)-dependent dehydrogenase (short-subunit alcohol dehydrogenase family)
MRLKGKTALVTGGGSGIGLATALAFLREGARVAIGEIAPGHGAEAAARAAAQGHDLPVLAGDVSREADARLMVEETVRRFGRIDILFNNAGSRRAARCSRRGPGDRCQLGAFLVSKHAVPHMLKQGGGAIVNTASISAIIADPGGAAYCASKGGVAMLTKAMAIDYAKSGIRVNAVCPGWVETGMFRQEAASRGLTLEEYRARSAAQQPTGRIGTPEEIAALVVFLASDEASFVTGALYVADGGYTAL